MLGLAHTLIATERPDLSRAIAPAIVGCGSEVHLVEFVRPRGNAKPHL